MERLPVMRLSKKTITLFFVALFTALVKAEECKSYRNEYHAENTHPHQNAANALRFNIYEEIGVDEWRCRVGDQNRFIKLQYYRLNKEEYYVRKRKTD